MTDPIDPAGAHQSPADRIRGLLHHVELYVSDLKRSREFWGWFLELLGYEVVQQWEDGTSWLLGETYIVLVQTPPEHRDTIYHRRATGLNHLAFHASSRADVDRLTALLRERGTTILYEDRHPFAGGEGYYAVFFEDPDRIKLELVAPDEEAQ